jgi:hypothetical protein
MANFDPNVEEAAWTLFSMALPRPFDENQKAKYMTLSQKCTIGGHNLESYIAKCTSEQIRNQLGCYFHSVLPQSLELFKVRYQTRFGMNTRVGIGDFQAPKLSEGLRLDTSLLDKIRANEIPMPIFKAHYWELSASKEKDYCTWVRNRFLIKFLDIYRFSSLPLVVCFFVLQF